VKIEPSRIRLIASTICQLKCPTCPTTQGIIGKNLGNQTLKFKDFKEFINANPWVKKIELAGHGEIFLNPDLPRMMQYSFRKGIELSAAAGSNLNTLSEEMAEALVKFRFHFISCSIDGASNGTYRIYRRNGDFSKVISNIRMINRYKKKYCSPLPRLQWQFILFGHNEHEILKAKLMALKLGMGFQARVAWDDFSPIKDKEMVRRLTGLDVFNRDEYREKTGKAYLSSCAQMWINPQINADGRVFGCCMNYWSDFGNAFKENFLDILNSEKMNYTRLMLLGKKTERSDIPCLQCPYYKEMKMTGAMFFIKEKSAS